MRCAPRKLHGLLLLCLQQLKAFSRYFEVLGVLQAAAPVCEVNSTVWHAEACAKAREQAAEERAQAAVAAAEARAQAREQAAEARHHAGQLHLQRQINDLRTLSLPSCIMHIKSTAAQILLTLTENQLKQTDTSSEFFSNPAALTSRRACCSNNIVNGGIGAVHANGATLDADVNLCLKMFESYMLSCNTTFEP
jgi:hypothetical protein